MIRDLFSLENKLAVITGGNQGIGKVVARYLAGAGADVALLDVKDATEVAEAIESEYGVSASSYICDVTDSDAVDSTLNLITEEMGCPDILFNNAGIVYQKECIDLDNSEWDKVINVNLNGVFYVARAFARLLKAAGKGGSVINTASMSGLIVNTPQPQASYNATKAAVIQLTKSLAIEWIDLGIRVNCISPGYIKTELVDSIRKDWQEYWLGLIPMKRMGTPEELAGAVIYLASDASSYTTASNIVIDGGFTSV